MADTRDRKLTTQEIGIMLHLLRTGGDGHRPVLLLPGARRRAAGLVRLSLVEIWHRQSIASGRSEGPFYCLSFRGRELAQSLYERREKRPRSTRPPEPPDFVHEQGASM